MTKRKDGSDMRKILKIIIIVCSLLFVAGCAPAYLVGGLVAVGMIDEGLKNAEKEKTRKVAEKRELKEKQEARLREEEVIRKEAPVFLADVEHRLKNGNWGREALPELLKKISYLDREFLLLEIRQRLNLATGLYAYLAGDVQNAKIKFKNAKVLGVKNPRMIVPAVWTPGSIEAFNTS